MGQAASERGEPGERTQGMLPRGPRGWRGPQGTGPHRTAPHRSARSGQAGQGRLPPSWPEALGFGAGEASTEIEGAPGCHAWKEGRGTTT